MHFDARAAKALQPGAHLTIDGSPGLRLEATLHRRAWTFRYRSPVDGRMRQLQLGLWPSMSYPAAVVEWERVKAERDAGADPALAKRQARHSDRTAAAAVKAAAAERGYTVRNVADDYQAGHVDRHRKEKGAGEVRRMFNTMLDPVADLTASTLTRRQCFDLLEGLQHIPVQAGKLRAELGAAWDYALDAGRLPENTPNWWRLIMRGRLRSQGKKIQGKAIGTAKRSLTERELRDLITWLPNFSRLVDDVLTLYLWTLARGAEIVAMHHGEISKEKDGWWWTVPKAKTKNARHANATDFRVPLVGRALVVVKRRMAEHKGQLFPSTGRLGYVEQKTIQTAAHYHQPYSKTHPDQVRPRLTVTHWAPHDLRRSMRTMLSSLECPDDVAEAMLGHMQEGVKGVYNLHSYDKQRRVWITRLSEHLEGLATVR